MLPPWLAYPSHPRYDIMWRMGGGEDYWYNFWDQYSELSTQQKKWYQQDFPEIKGWENIYMDINDYTTPKTHLVSEEDEDSIDNISDDAEIEASTACDLKSSE